MITSYSDDMARRGEDGTYIYVYIKSMEEAALVLARRRRRGEAKGGIDGWATGKQNELMMVKERG